MKKKNLFPFLCFSLYSFACQLQQNQRFNWSRYQPMSEENVIIFYDYCLTGMYLFRVPVIYFVCHYVEKEEKIGVRKKNQKTD